MSKEPLLDPSNRHLAHENVCLLEVASKKQLDELIADSAVRSIVWTRFGDTRALVDPTRVDDLKARLAELEVSCRYRDSLTGEDQ